MALKSICGLLSTKPRALDVILQFVPVVSLLQPLCHQLDTWRYEDDHGKHLMDVKSWLNMRSGLSAGIR
jgi:mediator of RNA polymerase II transcription subunit 5